MENTKLSISKGFSSASSETFLFAPFFSCEPCAARLDSNLCQSFQCRGHKQIGWSIWFKLWRQVWGHGTCQVNESWSLKSSKVKIAQGFCLFPELRAPPSFTVRPPPLCWTLAFQLFSYFQVLWLQNWPANRPGCRDSKHEVDALSRRWSSTDGNIQQRNQLRVPQRRHTHTGVGGSASYIPIGKLCLNII